MSPPLGLTRARPGAVGCCGGSHDDDVVRESAVFPSPRCLHPARMEKESVARWRGRIKIQESSSSQSGCSRRAREGALEAEEGGEVQTADRGVGAERGSERGGREVVRDERPGALRKASLLHSFRFRRVEPARCRRSASTGLKSWYVTCRAAPRTHALPAIPVAQCCLLW